MTTFISPMGYLPGTMHRTFETSTRRRGRTLDGQWQFVTAPDGEGYEENYAEQFPVEAAEPVAVPSAWNSRDAYEDYVGPAWYRRTFDLDDPTSVLLTFHGVGHDATVFLDGEEVASHEGGFTPFSALGRELSTGRHELVVRADNRLRETTVPAADADFFPYGGIYREVVIEEVPEVYVRDLSLAYDLDGDDATVEAEVTVHNVGAETAEPELWVSVGEQSTGREVEVFGMDATTEALSLTVEDVDRWSPDEPRLYDAVARLARDEGDVTGRRFFDDHWDRVGFREVAVEGRDLLVNGEPTTLAGVVRREDHPDWGRAQPLQIQRRDVDALDEAGFTAVRTRSPVHPRLLDICDEAGLLVVEDIPLSGVDRGTANSVAERAQRTLVQTVERDGDHPAVVGWCLADDCATDDSTVVSTVETLRAVATGLDDSRPVAVASSVDWDDAHDAAFESCDLLFANGPRGRAADRAAWADHFDRLESDYGEKPIVASRVRAAARSDDEDPDDGADGLADVLDLCLDRESVAGFAVDQFADTRPVLDDADQPAEGIVTDYRQPRPAYRTVAELLDSRP